MTENIDNEENIKDLDIELCFEEDCKGLRDTFVKKFLEEFNKNSEAHLVGSTEDVLTSMFTTTMYLYHQILETNLKTFFKMSESYNDKPEKLIHEFSEHYSSVFNRMRLDLTENTIKWFIEKNLKNKK